MESERQGSKILLFPKRFLICKEMLLTGKIAFSDAVHQRTLHRFLKEYGKCERPVYVQHLFRYDHHHHHTNCIKLQHRSLKAIRDDSKYKVGRRISRKNIQYGCPSIVCRGLDERLYIWILKN